MAKNLTAVYTLAHVPPDIIRITMRMNIGETLKKLRLVSDWTIQYEKNDDSGIPVVEWYGAGIFQQPTTFEYNSLRSGMRLFGFGVWQGTSQSLQEDSSKIEDLPYRASWRWSSMLFKNTFH